MTEEADQRAVERARSGDTEALWARLEQYRARLRAMVGLRIHPAVRPRIDASDIVQDSFVDVVRRLPEYLEDDGMPLYLWIRFLTNQKLAELHRRHLDADLRDARREIRIDRSGAPSLSAYEIARVFAESQETPSVVVGRAEAVDRLREVLEELDDIDREILVLRHFERLTNSEVARVLGLAESAAGMRYLRALKRLGSRFGEE